MNRMPKLLIALLLLVAILGAVALAAVLYVHSADHDRDGTVAVAGLDGPVEIVWTDRAVPHVWASTPRDALFTQGFLHARDRLWQMDLVRRAVQGRLAEVMGEQALGTDRFMRRLALWDAALASVELMTAEERGLLQAYADGVNAALDGWRGALPPEFLVLRYEPEPWEPVHTLAVAKMMSLTLAAYGESVAVARALRRLPAHRVRWLFPDFHDWGPTILSGAPEPPVTPALAASLIHRYSIATASNSWVIHGSMTRSGRPILANDMHLELQAPSLWYLIALHAPGSSSTEAPAHSDAGPAPDSVTHDADDAHGPAAPDPDASNPDASNPEPTGPHRLPSLDGSRALDVVGVSIPGAPFVITGRNRAISWGLTNAYVDDVDIFLERVDPDDPARYLTPEGSQPFETVTETIDVKGWDAPDTLRFRRTRHGPVLPIDAEASGDTVLALQWTAFEPTTVFRGVIAYNLASDWDEFLAAVDEMDDPHQNLVYADTAGHIGYIMGGTVPIRGDRKPAPVAPRPGWTGEYDWQGALPFDEHPRAFDPDEGLIVTANNRQVAGPLAELISQTWNQPFRAVRIAEMIRNGSPPYDDHDVLEMQLDRFDLFVERTVDRAIEAAESAGLPDAANRLRNWDHRAGPDSRAATLFYTWNEILRRALASDLYRGESAYFTRATAGVVLERRAIPWGEDPGSAYRRLAEAAMRDAVATVDDRPWSRANRAVHSHALGDIAILDRLLGLDIGPSPHYGSPTTVNVAHWAFQRPGDDFPFTTTAGPSMRQVVDMGNTDAAGGFVIPTGQSGLPFSEHYDDQTPMWRDGGLLELPLDREALDRLARQRLTLDPEPPE